MQVISFTSADGDQLADVSNVCMRDPERQTFKILELYLPIHHALCALIKAKFIEQTSL